MSKERPNFRIIENYEPEIDWEQFVEDYLDANTSIDDICRKYDISRKKYYTYRKQLVEDYGIKIKPSRGRYSTCSNPHRHIHYKKSDGTYKITKVVDGRSVYFGQYRNMEDALRVRNLLMEHEWDYDYYLEVIRPIFSAQLDFTIPKGFEDDFLEGMAVVELRKKYDLSLYHYYNLATMVKQKYGLRRKPMKVKV